MRRRPDPVPPEGDTEVVQARPRWARLQVFSDKKTVSEPQGNHWEHFCELAGYPLSPRPAPMSKNRQLKPRKAATCPTRASDRCVVRANVYSSTGVAFVDSAWLGLAFWGPEPPKQEGAGHLRRCNALLLIRAQTDSRRECNALTQLCLRPVKNRRVWSKSLLPSLALTGISWRRFFYFFFYQQFSRSSGRQPNPHRG